MFWAVPWRICWKANKKKASLSPGQLEDSEALQYCDLFRGFEVIQRFDHPDDFGRVADIADDFLHRLISHRGLVDGAFVDGGGVDTLH